MKNLKSHTPSQNWFSAFLCSMEGMKADMCPSTSAKLSGKVGAICHQNALHEQREVDDFIPDTLPLVVNPKAKISKDGTIENISEFKTLDDVFDFSRCLQCSALHHEYYCSSHEFPCMKCQSMMAKIKEKNQLQYHILHDFQSSSLIH